ncbi:pilus assembly protein PilP [Legionella fairfieldensis]|uniref:pilus assembly protein PilP n=1 Tax=Legionella fairfieldensis TaxID=45064 RepID=UPI0006864C2C|nr:pilus assembly protein PilP [Legionella fairfieldensis]
MKINKLLMAFISLMLMSCNADNDKKLTNYINKIKIKNTLPIKPIKSLKILSDFHYIKYKNNPNPFKKIFEVKKQTLGQFPLSSLHFVGVLKKGSVVWALICPESGDVFHVKNGDYIGENNNIILKISDKFIRIEESVNVGGRSIRKIKELTLSSSE